MRPPKLSLPDPLVLLTACVLLGAAASWVLPAGEFDRHLDEATGRSLVVAGTYHAVERDPVGPFEALVALPRGMIEAADVIFLVFLVGGAVTVVDATGALGRTVSAIVHGLGGRALLTIPVVSLFFALGGVTMNMQEEIVALVPMLLLLTSGMGVSPVVAVAMSLGTAFVGSAFSPINPFAVLIAQRVAELEPGSAWPFRTIFLAIALVLWIGWTTRLAARSRAAPSEAPGEAPEPLTGRDRIIMAVVLGAFAFAGYGMSALGWGFEELAAELFAMGVVAGLVAGLGIDGTARAFVRGFRDMTYAAILIGFARAIYVVLAEGRIVDTIVYALVQPLEALPALASAAGMIVANAAVHVPVPSNSGQAVLTMPVMVPLSDLLGIPRQATVLTYQVGGVLMDMLTPTNGALMAVLVAAGVRYEQWLRFALPAYLALLALGGVAVAAAIAIGLQ
ncbi:MAG TPA: Na+/H+ antiporter NhaC family protein [Longimicrobiales bacterium]|nr:Na+/H+ antiporter NhaC family protein [Longimicrobiales bacterium]